MSLAQVLDGRRARGRAAFVPFITAGDPSLAATAGFLRTLEAAGADIIELGVPFSDPVADGPVIQAAAERALRSGTTLGKVLDLVRRMSRFGFRTPVILFTYINPVLNMGYATFARRCARSGIEGVLAVDLPAEDSGPLASALRRRGVEIVLLASPTTSDMRLRTIGRASGSIVYYVSREGVTGARRDLPGGLASRLKRVRSLSGKPLIVGFGVSNGAHSRALAPHAAGVVVGSALVSEIAASSSARESSRRLSRLAGRIVKGLECLK